MSIDKYLNRSLEAVERCAHRVITYLEGEEQRVALDNLSEITKGYCMLEEKARISALSIEATKAIFEEKASILATSAESESTLEKDSSSFEQIYDAQFKERERDIKDMSTHVKYMKFCKSVDAALAQAKGGAPEGDGDDRDDDDEVRVTEAEVNTIDPISQQPIVTPVKNQLCGHTYEKTTIMQLLRTRKRLRCPYVGCPNAGLFGPDDLKEV